jgi:hypothetical protein
MNNASGGTGFRGTCFSESGFSLKVLTANLCRALLQLCPKVSRIGAVLALPEKVIYFVIPSEARNLSFFCWLRTQERFLASLGMTKGWDTFSGTCLAFGLTGGAH